MRNRTFCEGDNLEFLLRMPDGSVDLIATDPPFNKNKEFQGIGKAEGANFKDYWAWDSDEDVHPAYLAHIKQHWPALGEVIEAAYAAHSPSMAAFLAFMSVRLIEMHRILKPTGSIYVHCDDAASHYLKAMMDAVFGVDNFRNEIIWKRTAGRTDGKHFGRVHDSILFYASSRATWNQPFLPHEETYVSRTYRMNDNDDRGVYRLSDLTAAGTSKGESGSPWRGIDPTDANRHWITPTQGGMSQYIRERQLLPDWPDAYPSVHARLDALDKVGLIHWPTRGSIPSLKRYLASTRGRAVEDVFADIGKLESNDKEKIGWPTQKPLALYKRMIEASSNEGDLVLDPFAGCATTCVAAEQAGRSWIGIDLSPKAKGITLDRLKKEAGEGTLWEKNVRLLTVKDLPSLKNGITAALSTPNLPGRRQRGIPRGYKPEDVRPYLAVREAAGTRRRGMNTSCQGCGYAPPDNRLEYMDTDHIIPRTKGGPNSWDNLCLLCPPCNRRKAHRLSIEELRNAVLADGLRLDKDALVPMDAASIAKRDRAARPLQ